jgi:indole-3-glycerol phosphate synthase
LIVTANSPNGLKGIRAGGGILDKIVAAKAVRLSDARCLTDELASKARARSFRSLSAALTRQDEINIIAEIKHRSPSKGIIREQFDPVSIADSYWRSGAAALSVLTEQDFFGGSLDHLTAASQAVRLPILRKDFVFDEFQLLEAAGAGADAVLLIVAILEDSLLAALLERAGEIGLEALVEVHSDEEMKRAGNAGARIIGVNNRDLKTFNVDLNTSLRLAPLAPPQAVLVSESGINTAGDILRLKATGYNGFLVGEHFMRAADPGAALAELIEHAGG